MTVANSSLQKPELLIVGASVRAAVQSALRAGYCPVAADRFLDEDTRHLCPVMEISSYPSGLDDAVRSTTASGWMYTGALENYPDLVERLSALRPLHGNSAAVLRAVRDPVRPSTALAEAGLPVPRMTLHSNGVPDDGTWLKKPLRSAGGASISRWFGGTEANDRYYFQQHISGPPCSAVFVAAGGEARLLGTTRQLSGTEWTGARRYQYSGSISMGRLSPDRRQQLEAVGTTLYRTFELIGLFGVDMIDAQGQFWPIEVNPRYTASVEVIERASGIHAIDLHMKACTLGSLPADEVLQQGYAGKAVIYAKNEIIVPEAFNELAHEPLAAARSGASATTLTDDCLNLQSRFPSLADIPAVGAIIPAHAPVTTVLAAGSDPADVERQLRDLSAQVQRVLYS